MRQFLLAAGLFAAVSHPVFAFDSPQCGEIESQIYTMLDSEFGWEVTQSPTSTSEAWAGGCAVTDLELYVQDLDIRYSIGAARMVAAEAMDWVRGDVILPDQVAFQLMDVSIDTDFGIPDDLAWLSDLSVTSITLSATWEEEIQALSIAPMRIDLGDENVITLALEGQAQGWEPYVMRDEDFGVTRVELNLAFNGFFEDVIAPPMEANGVDLSVESMTFFAAMSEALMATAPPSLLSSEARGAIVEFLQTLPTPRGDLTVSLSNDLPFMPEDVLVNLAAGMPFAESVPNQLTIDADWTAAQ